MPITLGHQRRARRARGCRRRSTDLLDRATCCPSGTRPSPSAWDAIADGPRRRAVAGPRAGPRARWSTFVRRRLRDAADGPRASRRPTWRGPTRCSTPSALTIGFARRFATYKRATLLLSPARAAQRAAAVDADRPVQFVFAGKAHPADDAGKELIRQIVQLLRRPRGPPPLRVPRRLRHRRRPRAATRAPTCG